MPGRFCDFGGRLALYRPLLSHGLGFLILVGFALTGPGGVGSRRLDPVLLAGRFRDPRDRRFHCGDGNGDSVVHADVLLPVLVGAERLVTKIATDGRLRVHEAVTGQAPTAQTRFRAHVAPIRRRPERAVGGVRPGRDRTTISVSQYLESNFERAHLSLH